ncbi:hypothetical protein QFZ94_001030 [Paraburkholderia sp. JPY465]
MRSHLLAALGVRSFYELDRLDVQATGTLNNDVQQAVAERLAAAATKDGAKAAGLVGYEMLRGSDDPSHIAYSFTLFERHGDANLVRVQTDSVNQPFDINSGARLNLGSTAKPTHRHHVSADRHRSAHPLRLAEQCRAESDHARSERSADALGDRLSAARARPFAAADARRRRRA